MEDLNLIKEFIEKIDISQDDALEALLSAFAPAQASALRQGWITHDRFGHSSPSTKDIWKKFEDADFRCNDCGSQYRISLDHIDSNPLNHSLDNLAVLCSACNRGKSSKGTRDKKHQLRIYRAIIEYWNEHEKFPSNSEILTRAGVEQIGGSTYMVKWLEDRLTGKNIPK